MDTLRLTVVLFIAGSLGPLVMSMIITTWPETIGGLLFLLALASFRVCWAATKKRPDEWWWWWIPLCAIPIIWSVFIYLALPEDIYWYLMPGVMIVSSVVGCIIGRIGPDEETPAPKPAEAGAERPVDTTGEKPA
jgi:hypothetical protein